MFFEKHEQHKQKKGRNASTQKSQVLKDGTSFMSFIYKNEISPDSCCIWPDKMTDQLRTFGDVFPYFYDDVLHWTVFFCIAYHAIQTVLYVAFPRMMANMANDSVRTDYVNYWFSLVNHVPIVMLAFGRLVYNPRYTFMATMSADEKDEEKDPADQSFYQCESTAYITGYFIADLCLYVLPIAFQGNYTYVFHHLASIFLGCLAPYIPISLTRHCTRILFMEVSSILLALRFLYKKSGFTNQRVIQALGYGFVGSFFAVRVYSILIMIIEMGTELIAGSETPRVLTSILFAFGALWCLQVWWFGKMVMRLNKGRAV